MHKNKICTVVIGNTREEFLYNLREIQKISDFVELRADYIQSLMLSDIDIMRQNTTKQAIFTCRKKSEGGLFSGNEQQRMLIIEKASRLAFEYIDIELASSSLLTNIHEKSKIILSFHDTKKTPSYQELETIKKQMNQFPGVIMKFSTTIHTDSDIHALFQLLLNKQSFEEMIILGMGEKGKLIRVLAPLLGSYLTFASSKFSQSAPGQIDIQSMQNLYTILGSI